MIRKMGLGEAGEAARYWMASWWLVIGGWKLFVAFRGFPFVLRPFHSPVSMQIHVPTACSVISTVDFDCKVMPLLCLYCIGGKLLQDPAV